MDYLKYLTRKEKSKSLNRRPQKPWSHGASWSMGKAQGMTKSQWLERNIQELQWLSCLAGTCRYQKLWKQKEHLDAFCGTPFSSTLHFLLHTHEGGEVVSGEPVCLPGCIPVKSQCHRSFLGWCCPLVAPDILLDVTVISEHCHCPSMSVNDVNREWCQVLFAQRCSS